MSLQSTYQPHLRKLTRMNKTDIESTLTADFSPDVLHVIDDSAKHRGHKGTPHTENTHFNITIVSSIFTGMRLIDRHRAIHNSLKAGFALTLHALKITAKTPDEWDNAGH